MSKVKIGITILVLLCLISVLVFIMSVRGEFKSYLANKYPDKKFTVDFFVKFDPIYMKYYTGATCLDDYTQFSINRGTNSAKIKERYLQNKSRNYYNSLLEEIFKDSIDAMQLKSVAGNGNKSNELGRAFYEIFLYLPENVNHSRVINESLVLLKENNISFNKVFASYEKDGGLYEFKVDGNVEEVDITGIEEKTRRVK